MNSSKINNRTGLCSKALICIALLYNFTNLFDLIVYITKSSDSIMFVSIYFYFLLIQIVMSVRIIFIVFVILLVLGLVLSVA